MNSLVIVAVYPLFSYICMLTFIIKSISFSTISHSGFRFTAVEISYSHCIQNNNNHQIYQMFYILPPVLKKTVSFSHLNEGLWLLQSILQPKTWWPFQIIYQLHIVPPLQYLSKSSFVLCS